MTLIEPWVNEHKRVVEQSYIDLGRTRKNGDVTREHNSSFTRWFKQTQELLAKTITLSTEEEKLIFALSRGPGQNVKTYQAFTLHVLRNIYHPKRGKNGVFV